MSETEVLVPWNAKFILANMLEAVKVIMEMGSEFPLDDLVEAVRDEMLDTERGDPSLDWTIPQKFFMDVLVGVFDTANGTAPELTVDERQGMTVDAAIQHVASQSLLDTRSRSKILTEKERYTSEHLAEHTSLAGLSTMSAQVIEGPVTVTLQRGHIMFVDCHRISGPAQAHVPAGEYVVVVDGIPKPKPFSLDLLPQSEPGPELEGPFTAKV